MNDFVLSSDDGRPSPRTPSNPASSSEEYSVLANSVKAKRLKSVIYCPSVQVDVKLTLSGVK